MPLLLTEQVYQSRTRTRERRKQTEWRKKYDVKSTRLVGAVEDWTIATEDPKDLEDSRDPEDSEDPIEEDWTTRVDEDPIEEWD